MSNPEKSGPPPQAAPFQGQPVPPYIPPASAPSVQPIPQQYYYPQPQQNLTVQAYTASVPQPYGVSPNPPTYDQSMLTEESKVIKEATPRVAPSPSPAVNPGAPVYINAITTCSVPRSSCRMYCPNCKKEVNTIVDFENTGLVWIICIILCIFTGIFCFIPFCIRDIKDCVHYCPSCRREIGRNQRN